MIQEGRLLTELQIITLIAIVISSVLLEAMSQVRDEACETLQTEIHVTKEEFDEVSRLIRTCSGDISVNKCEGGCNSNVQPSVVTPNGFLKECYCCRESFLKERIITLTHCYDPDGVRLTSEKLAEMEVKVKEPANCKCYKCGNNPA